MANEKLYAKLDEILDKKKHLRFQLNSRDGRREYFKVISIIKYCLNCLGPDYREILEQSYLDCDYKFWWVDKYCKSSFYRKRIKAIQSFVSLFELIYENYPHFSNNIGHSFSL